MRSDSRKAKASYKCVLRYASKRRPSGPSSTVVLNARTRSPGAVSQRPQPT